MEVSFQIYHYWRSQCAVKGVRMRKRTSLMFLAILPLVLSGCSGKEASSADSGESAGAENAAETVRTESEMFTERDYQTDYEESESAEILLTGDGAQSDSDSVKVSGSTVAITEEGTYILSGELTDGMILVEVGDRDKVHLVLNGVSISNSTSAALYVREADKVFVTSASGTENFLSNGGEYAAIDENNIDAVIFSKSDLTLNGGGSLTIQAAAGHGVVSKDDLAVTGGTYAVEAAGHGFSGKDSIRLADGDFTVQSGKDGFHSENSDDASLGFFYIAAGNFQITADGDGLSAGSDLEIQGGEYLLLTGGGSAEAETASNIPGSWETWETESEEGVSAKGVKASGDLILAGGSFSVDSADDSLHSNSNITVSAGEYQLSTGDDGIHADANVTISGGDIRIIQSYEGIEGLTIDIQGGTIELTASDDGLNAAGGNDESGFEGPGAGFRGQEQFAADSDAYIHIAGGTLYINASGDGIDSNGSLTVSGGGDVRLRA